MLEYTTDPELRAHFAQAHVARSQAVRAAFFYVFATPSRLWSLLQSNGHENGPVPAGRPIVRA